MADRPPVRHAALHGSTLPTRVGSFAVTPIAHSGRLSWRGPPEPMSSVFGVDLPTTPMRAACMGDRVALWLGPDEWLLLLPEADLPSLRARLSAAPLAMAGSLVDISHRDVGLLIAGRDASWLLAAGCPLDLDISAFPVGMCTRTLLAKAEIVLWRSGADVFRLEVQRSFASYVAAFLCEAAHDSPDPAPR